MRKVILKSCKTGLKCRIIKKKGKYLVQYHGKGESPIGFDPWGHDEWSRWRTLDGCMFILFMNHHEPDEKHVYWHLLPVHKSVKPDFRYNYTWFGERAREVNARSKEQNMSDASIARIALKRYSND